MNKKIVISISFMVIVSNLNPLTTNVLLKTGHCLNQKIVDHDFTYSYQGLHPINSYGWYITTKNKAQEVIFLQSYIDTHFYKKIFIKKHKNSDLALVKFNIEEIDIIPNESNLLEGIETQENLEKRSWVLSLAKVPVKESRLIQNKITDFCLPLQVISQIIKIDDLFLTLHQGNLDDFFEIKCPLLKEKWFHTIDKLFYKLRPNVAISCKPVFIENQSPTKKELFEKYIDWNDDINCIDTQKPYRLYIEENMKTRGFVDIEFDILQTLKKNICNGIADVNDIGGGIYEYPILLKNGSSLIYDRFAFPLIGITVPGGKTGETSIAINLTTPQIRQWILKVISRYYMNNKTLNNYFNIPTDNLFL